MLIGVVFLAPVLLLTISNCWVFGADPEEMRRAQEEMRSQGVPSLANLLPGAAGRSS